MRQDEKKNLLKKGKPLKKRPVKSFEQDSEGA